MKKFITVIISIVIAMGLVACESDMAKKAMEQGKLSLANMEYEKALALIILTY